MNNTMHAEQVTRDVAYLDRNATNDFASAGMALVAVGLARQFAKHNGFGGRKKVTTRDVRAALIAHGASTLTVELFARRIASRIRNDFSDGSER